MGKIEFKSYRTMEDIKAANKNVGYHYFDDDTMRFFDSVIVGAVSKERGGYGGTLYGPQGSGPSGYYFITGERPRDDEPRRYAVRVALPSGKVQGVGEICEFATPEEATNRIMALLRAEQAGEFYLRDDENFALASTDEVVYWSDLPKALGL